MGGEFCLEQASALKALGHEVRILSCNQLAATVSLKNYVFGNWHSWTEEMYGIEVWRTNMRALPKWVGYNQKRWCGAVVAMYERYKKRYGKPDVLHAHCCLWGGVAARMISERDGIPYYITEHLPTGTYTAFGDGWTKHLWVKDLLRETFEKANCVIPVSDELTDDIAPFFGKNYRYRTTSNIIDTDFFAYRERPKREGRKFRFCCLAYTDMYRKGYDVLRDAFRNFPDAELHIAGRGTADAKFRKYLDGIDNVIIHGTLKKKEVRDLLYECDALVLASRSEAQPLVILEAMSTGIPVVATECTPQIERVPGACLIAAIGDAVSLREKMMEVMSISPSEDISLAARRICSPDAVASKIENIFNTFSNRQ